MILRIKYNTYLCNPNEGKRSNNGKLIYGVIGNTSAFGAEESRFEPWWINKRASKFEALFLCPKQTFWDYLTFN